MLQISNIRPAEAQTLPPAAFVTPAEFYAAALGFLRRQFPVIAFAFLLTLALGTVYIFTSPPRYAGHAVLIIDAHRTQLFQPQSQLGNLPLDSAAVDTQIQIINSENIALSVIKDLHLNEDPEFVSPNRGLLGTIAGFFSNAITGVLKVIVPALPEATNEPSPEDLVMQRALRAFLARLKVNRVGLTYAIGIDFQSASRSRAAQIANAVADAYVVDALEAKYQTTRRAAIWLQDRLRELREQSSNAERAVVDYKAKNNIVDTGGRLMNEQQLAELNSALIQTRAATAEAKARLDRVEQILASGNVDPGTAATATVTDTLHNEVITKMRAQYLEYDARASDWAKKYGLAHLAVVNLHNQMRELRRTIFEELKRTAETYKSDYEIAKTREDSIRKSLRQIVSESQTTNEAQITLHNLESSAQTYRALYDNFLQRYMESVQQQSFPLSESRLITQARPPLIKSSPRPLLVMALAALGGLIFGAGIGMLRDISDRVFRTTVQIAERLQSDCIAVVPLVKQARKRGDSDPLAQATSSAVPPGRLEDPSLHAASDPSPLWRLAETTRGVVGRLRALRERYATVRLGGRERRQRLAEAPGAEASARASETPSPATSAKADVSMAESTASAGVNETPAISAQVDERVGEELEEASSALSVEQASSALAVQMGEVVSSTASTQVNAAADSTESAPEGDAASPTAPQTIARDSNVGWKVVTSPLSRFTESIRAIKVAADISSVVKANKTIGITSSLPNEGKSTIAMSLAELITYGGGRGVLVDCDLRNPHLSRRLAPDAEAGLVEVVAGKAALGDVLWHEPASRLTFLPAVMPSRLAHTTEILASDANRKLFELLRETYDYVIVDLSPLAPVVDVRVMASLVDAFVLVVEWGRTKIDVVEHALGNARGVRDNLLGVVLNKADMNAFGRYASYRGTYYHSRYYARYGYTD